MKSQLGDVGAMGLGDLGLGLALSDAVQGDEVDPSAIALMEKQVRMLDLQMNNLRKETRQLGVKFLRERLHAGFELAVAAVVIGGVMALGLMAWQASRAEGLSIQTFSTPGELSSRGLTGTVLASKLSDGLGEIEAVTSSVRAGGAIRAVRRQEVKVEIPNTGLSIGELQALLRGWLGHETEVNGELVKDGDILSLTVRVGDRPGITVRGPQKDLDQLIRSASEQVLAATEPYRYAVYLGAQERRPQALAVAESLAASGAPTDRAWGYALWGRLLAAGGDFVGASAKARRAIALDPDVAAAHDNLAAAQRLLGHDQAALSAAEGTLQAMRRQKRQMDKVNGPARLATAEGRVLEARGDFGGAARLYGEASRLGGLAHASQAVASLPRALAADHDIDAARRALDDLQGQLAEDSLPDAIPAPGLVALLAGDWAQAERDLRKADATAVMFGASGATVRATQVTPYLALAQAMSGQVDAARGTIATTPSDCYVCARVRAIIAGRAGDRPQAERLFKAAVALAPSRPAAYLDWARMRLAAGDAPGAIDRAREAARLAPAWADPLQVWGEALARSGDPRNAAQKFSVAADLSPAWGLPLLGRAQALERLGDPEAAARLRRAAAGLWLTAAERAELQQP